MKFIFLAGGAAGFLLAAIAGYSADRSADRILFDAALGCLVGALLFRWFWTVLVRGMRETILSRQPAEPAPSHALPGVTAPIPTPKPPQKAK